MGIGDVKSRHLYIALSEANNDKCLVFNDVFFHNFSSINIIIDDSELKEIKSHFHQKSFCSDV